MTAEFLKLKAARGWEPGSRATAPPDSLTAMTETKQTRVFISYSHDSDSHKARVLELARRLAGDGLDCALDQYEPHPAEGWPAWIDRQLDEADFVLVVCSEGYYRKARPESAPSQGSGCGSRSEVLHLSDKVTALAVLADGRVVSAFGWTLRVWDLATGEIAKTLKGHTDEVTALAMLPDGRAVSGSGDTTLRVWDLATGETTRTLEGHSNGVIAVAVLADGRVVSATDDGTLRVWDVAAGVAVARLTLDAPLSALAAVGERGIVAGDLAGRLHLLRLEDPT
jgi:WD40 repeat protein